MNVCPWDGCQREFETERGVSTHQWRTHGEVLKEELEDGIECPWSGCQRELQTQRAVSVHHNIVHGESIPDGYWECGSFDCPQNSCMRSFDTRRGLSIHHNKMHGKELNSKEEFKCGACGEVFERYPSTITVEPPYCSLSCRPRADGEDHPHWEPNCTNIWYGPNWDDIREEVLDRDGYKCTICGTSENLHVHHIVPVRAFTNVESAHQMGNLVTLCQSHHSKVENAGLESPMPKSPLTPVIANE